jgi:hypothetical protein
LRRGENARPPELPRQYYVAFLRVLCSVRGQVVTTSLRGM